ncbi:F-box protein At5g07610-like [Miscanthus floridulus]|uniref:F-box protein At5g07610-like n=1 Tax=Miscanthus floridulus TaxID=154761 RepID=UPI003459A979
MDPSKKSACAAAYLTDDIIVEILSRLPVKSICRFKCVSWHWYGLITHSEHRTKIPQTLSGFFYPGYRLNREENDIVIFSDFVDITGREELPFSDPSLPFLSGYRLIIPKICCNGLLFCLCWKVSPRDEANYVVCNPATEKWFVLPESDYDSGACAYRFSFDPAVSSHFHVFQILEEDEDYGFIAGVNIYSSETGAWSHKGNGWGNELQLVDSRGVFFKGILHLMTNCFKILAVDTQGKIWRSIPLLETMCAENFGRNLLSSNLTFIGQSRGQLYYINMRERDLSVLSVWILEDYGSDEWIFKYNISTSQLFGEKGLGFEQDYALIAIHPECSLIYFVWKCEGILMSYDMERGKVCVICNAIERLYDPFLPYLPYVPFLSGSARLEA